MNLIRLRSEAIAHAYPIPRDRSHAVDDPGNLFTGRVTGTAEPDQTLIGHTEPLGDGHRVEVAMGGEDPPVGQSPADLSGRLAFDGKGERRRAGRIWRRPEKPHAFDRR